MKQITSMIVFVLVLGSILTSALVGVDKWTAPRIAQNERRKVCAGVLEAFNIEYTKSNLLPIFEQRIKSETLGEGEFFRAESGNIAFLVEGMGLQGPIEGVVALQPDLKTIAGLAITKQEETPGLGGRIGEKAFRDTFVGKRVEPSLKIVKPGSPPGDNVVDGITGATLSCNQLQKLLNNEIQGRVAQIREGRE